jgi:Zn-dependent M28 family amino/carboxypeptidase
MPATGAVRAGRVGDPPDPAAVLGHLAEFARIADRNGGTRASGTPGHDESVDYVADLLRGAGFDVAVREFPITYAETLAERLVVAGEELDVTVMRYSPNTPPGGITATLSVLPPGRTRGCDPADFAGGAHAGRIVLVERGGCPHARKQQNAAAAGAAGVLVHNTDDEWLLGTLVSPDEARIPTGGISRALGEQLRSMAGAPVTLDLCMSAEPRTSRTVVAQTRTGRRDNVVMAGAHLDSVVEGPGINDAATGCAALLETALRLGPTPPVANAVRFAWWGAEEFGQVGSTEYVEGLGTGQRLDIALYLNVDMLGSSNGGYFVFSGADLGDRAPAGCAALEAAFRDALAGRGVASEPLSLVGGFDHMPFVDAGIAAGGLYTGATGIKTADQAAKWGGTAGLAFDPGYHRAADDLDNVDRTALAHNTAALAAVTARYAADTTGLPDRAARSAARSTLTHKEKP